MCSTDALLQRASRAKQLVLCVTLTAACGSSAQQPADGGGGPDAAIAFFDPVSAAHVATAFGVARQHAATLFSSSEVKFLAVQGIPGGPGDSYLATPWTWEYTFSACDASSTPCATPKYFSITQPGWTVTAPVWQTTGASIVEADFAATVPLSLEEFLVRTPIDVTFCPMWPIVNSASFIRLEGGVKSGSGAVIWFWTFACNNQNPAGHYFRTNGDPVAP